jgi:hypothetical protein
LILGAALDCAREGIIIKPQIMLPLISSDHEVSLIVPVIRNAYDLVCGQYNSIFPNEVKFIGMIIFV